MPHIMLFMLALADIFSGVLLFFHPSFLLKLLFYFAIISLTKGGWSLISAFMARFYFDLLGFLDIVAGISLILLYYKFMFPFFTIIGIMMIMKGVWSMFFSFAS